MDSAFHLEQSRPLMFLQVTSIDYPAKTISVSTKDGRIFIGDKVNRQQVFMAFAENEFCKLSFEKTTHKFYHCIAFDP